MTEDMVLVSVICPKCNHTLVEVHSDIMDDDLNIYFPSITDSIDELSNNFNHDPDSRYIKCTSCNTTYQIKNDSKINL